MLTKKINSETPTTGDAEIARQLVLTWEPNFQMRILLQRDNKSLDKLIGLIAEELTKSRNEGCYNALRFT